MFVGFVRTPSQCLCQTLIHSNNQLVNYVSGCGPKGKGGLGLETRRRETTGRRKVKNTWVARRVIECRSE
jgi:hypothetical protein